MMKHIIWFLIVTCSVQVLIITCDDDFEYDKKPSSVLIAILVRNKAHALPYFLTLLTQLDYPKSRMIIWIRSDHNEDNSANVLKKWVEAFRLQYHLIDLKIDNFSTTTESKESISSWSESRYKLLIKLREEALQTARRFWADYIWFLDCDSFITNPTTLSNLMKKQKVIVASMLMSDSMYSNFWCGMTPTYYYVRTEDYEEILNRKKIGCFPVPMVHSAVLVDLRVRASDLLTFVPANIRNYSGPIDDIIAFAVGAKMSGIQLHVCNDVNYGYTMVPLDEDENLMDDKNHLTNLKLYITVDEPALPIDDIFSELFEFPVKSKFIFDEIFVINLKRRSERKLRMNYCLNELGINATFIDAVDGMSLKDDELNEMGVEVMASYQDPYYKRPMKKGEIGCFLSHYKIWQNIVENDLKNVLVMEDDVRFERFFVDKLKDLINGLHRVSVSWDLVYLGRKILYPEQENFVDGTKHFVYPSYSYWTLGYIITLEGARKLVNAKPLRNLIPVDEFLPIMYNKHPRDDWKIYFPNRDLKAISVNPLIINPVKYTQDSGYVSDTEDSNVIAAYKFKNDEL